MTRPTRSCLAVLATVLAGGAPACIEKTTIVQNEGGGAGDPDLSFGNGDGGLADPSAPDPEPGTPEPAGDGAATSEPAAADASAPEPAPSGDLDAPPLPEPDPEPAEPEPVEPAPVPEPEPAKASLGGACEFHDDCETAFCNSLHPGGYCTELCAASTDCPESGQCWPDPKDPANKMCWKPCGAAGDCRIDQFCSKGGLCTPKCVPGGCPGDWTCDEASGICVDPNDPAVCKTKTEACNQLDDDCDGLADEGCGPGVNDNNVTLVADLGLLQVGGGKIWQTSTFDLSSSAGSFTIQLLAADASSETLFLYSLVDPKGLVLFDASNEVEEVIRAFPDLTLVTAQVPLSPAYDPPAGKYQFTVARLGDDVGYVWAYVIQSLRQEPVKSHLDVNLWFVGTPQLSAQTAKSSSKFQTLLESFFTILGEIGVTVGEVQYLDVFGADAQKYTFVDVESDLLALDEHAQLCQLSKALPKSNSGVNLFFVQGFNGTSALGQAAAIPGPPLNHGTVRSGVVVSLADYYGLSAGVGVPLTAEAMAHEIGHQLGLFHTTEQAGTFHDPLADTPECPASSDDNGDGVVDAVECEGKGAENLMFWQASFGTDLTPDQAHVLHRNGSMYAQ